MKIRKYITHKNHSRNISSVKKSDWDSGFMLNMIQNVQCTWYDCLGKPQKSPFFSDPATKTGGGDKGLATKKKDFFVDVRKKNSQNNS